MKPMTIRDVARAARVSPATVSYVLNHSGRVSSPTRKTVLATVRRLGYLPNLMARNLAKNTSQTLGIIVSDIENPFFPEVTKGFEKRAREKGYDVILSDTDYDSEVMAVAAKRMLRQQVRGVAFITSEAALHSIRQMTARHTALVFIDVGPVQAYVSNIKIDYFSGIKAVIDHLATLGHRQIAFVGARNDMYSNAARRDAYVRCMADLGMPLGCMLEGNSHFDGGLAAGAAISQLDPLPTAIVAMNDLTAIGIIKALKSRNLRVPEDVSVTGFDCTQLAGYVTPSLTTVDLKRDLLGRMAADALHDLCTLPNHMGQEYLANAELCVGESTAPARNGKV